jgi:lipopolysaccharide assembly protein A
MRWVYLAVIVLFALATIIFAVQNLETVTVAFLGFNASIRVAVLVAIMYLLGAVTGGSLFALLRKSYQRATRSAKVAP